MNFIENIIKYLWRTLFKKERVIPFVIFTFCFEFFFQMFILIMFNDTNINMFNLPSDQFTVVSSYIILKIILMLLAFAVLYGEKLTNGEKISIETADFKHKWQRVLFLYFIWGQIIDSTIKIIFSLYSLVFYMMGKTVPIIFFLAQTYFIGFIAAVSLIYFLIKA